MLIWAIIATLISVVTIVIFIAYRRQVKNTCRHLAFMKKNKTNLRLRSGLPFKELYELSDNVNELLDSSDELRQKAEHNEQSLKDAITNISHDIRTPLTSLDGFFQLLKNADSEEEREQCVDVIQNRINVLKYMLEELFTYTKLQNEQFTLATEPTDLKKCVLDTLFSFYNDFEERGIQPEADICEERLSIIGNAEAISRMVQNILKNALVHGSGRVAVKLGTMENKAVFICENSVSSPDEIDVTQVFKRFYKADTARTATSTGLGLAIAKGLAEKLGGTLTAELDGDIFRITSEFSL